MIWVWIGLAAAVGAVVALALVAAVGRESHERRGVLRFDTPRARSALRRCNRTRDVHYFGGQERCECGEVTYGELEPEYAGPPWRRREVLDHVPSSSSPSRGFPITERLARQIEAEERGEHP